MTDINAVAQLEAKDEEIAQLRRDLAAALRVYVREDEIKANVNAQLIERAERAEAAVVRLTEAINRLHEVARGEHEASYHDICDIVNAALKDKP